MSQDQNDIYLDGKVMARPMLTKLEGQTMFVFELKTTTPRQTVQHRI